MALNVRVNNQRALRLEPHTDGPNVIGGLPGNSVTAGVAGATVSGGVSDLPANRVTDRGGTVAGGVNNQAGNNNADTFDARFATVGGGHQNTASGVTATVGGGFNNLASGVNATITGGQDNVASNFDATVSGGVKNIASGEAATVAGGSDNAASATFSYAAGQRAKANHQGAFVWADSNNFNFASTAANQFNLRATGGTRIVTAVDGLGNPTASTTLAPGGSAIIGPSNTAIGTGALISNTTGSANTASGVSALLSNTEGNANTASGAGALFNNTEGNANTASGINALVSNTTGANNTASGVNALFSNTTGGNNTAIGFGADVCVLFCGNLTNATAIGNGAIVDASNKIRLGNSAVAVIEGQVAYTFTSDKTKKENFQHVDGEEVLKKISSLTQTSWNFIGHDPKQFRHHGPMAQDFFASFGNDGIGTIGTPTTINSGDMAGILMIAVQALEKQNRELRSRVEELERMMKDRPYVTASTEPVQ